MATKFFGMGNMACESVQAWTKSAKFGTIAGDVFTPATVDDGAFVKLGALATDTTYSSQVDWNCHQAVAPDAATYTADDICVVDISGVTEGVIAGNTYKIGAKLVDLKVAAGYPVRVRTLKKGDTFWLGAGCFESTPTVGQYANLTANKVTLTPAASTTANQLNIAIRASKPMTIGTTVAYANAAFEQEYLVEVL